jgi:hypothetical protein
VIVVLIIIAGWAIGVPLLYSLNLWVVRMGEPVESLEKASKRATFLFTLAIWTYTVTGLLLVDVFPSYLWAVLVPWVVIGYFFWFAALFRRRRRRSSTLEK